MKKYLLLAALFTNTLYAQSCPDLKGDYHCNFEDRSYSRLRVTQEEIDQNITLYGFDYLSIEVGADYVPASASGETDDFGWITKCKNGKLLSVPSNGANMLSEIYLDQNQAFTRKLNGNTVQVCPRAR